MGGAVAAGAGFVAGVVSETAKNITDKKEETFIGPAPLENASIKPEPTPLENASIKPEPNMLVHPRPSLSDNYDDFFKI